MIFLEDPRPRLAAHPDPDQCWLHCRECERFLQRKSIADNFCPFPDCCGWGLGFDIFWWDSFRVADDPRWPSSPDQLEHGMRSPDPEPFFTEQLNKRIERLIADLAAAPEGQALDGPPRYVRPLLQMMSDLCWDITTEPECDFSEDLADDIMDELPVWARTADLSEAPRMVAEIEALFVVADRNGTIADADRWLERVRRGDLEETFRNEMRFDRRLAGERRKLRQLKRQRRRGYPGKKRPSRRRRP